jgi:cytochrome c biogenesis protein CcmG/thiol:disulfide interchange protein DsbE
MADLEFLQPETVLSPQSRRVARAGALVLMAGILMVAAVIGLALIRNARGPLESGQAPDFSVITFSGQTLRLSELRGQVVVLNFWASWCLPCREEAPVLEQIWQQYGARGVTVIGIAWSDIESDSLAFMQEFDLSYANAPDTGTRIGDDYSIRAVPETYIIDRDGSITHRLIGTSAITVDNLSRILNSLLVG